MLEGEAGKTLCSGAGWARGQEGGTSKPTGSDQQWAVSSLQSLEQRGLGGSTIVM